MNEDLTLRELGESAINLAVQNVLDGGGPFGAIVVKDGKIIASGANSVTTTNDPTAHAEGLERFSTDRLYPYYFL